MKPDQKRLLRKLSSFLIVFLCFSIITPLLFKRDPMRYFDGEYSWYQENEDYSLSSKNDDINILILGDSTAKAAWLPSLLSSNMYNYSLGGASTVEEYYCLKEYLVNNERPAYVIYTQAISTFMGSPCFWTRSVYFHRLDFDDVLDVYKENRSLNNQDKLVTFLDLAKAVLYYSYSPLFYSEATIKGLVSSRLAENQSKYYDAEENDGHIYFGDGTGETTPPRLAPGNLVDNISFECNDLVDLYLRKIINLCEENEIQFIYQSSPIPSVTANKLKPIFLLEYNNYMKELEKEYPDEVFKYEIFSFQDDMFTDQSHLNKRGVYEFSAKMKEKYPDLFGVQYA